MRNDIVSRVINEQTRELLRAIEDKQETQAKCEQVKDLRLRVDAALEALKSK
jgi:hypothetical protein